MSQDIALYPPNLTDIVSSMLGRYARRAGWSNKNIDFDPLKDQEGESRGNHRFIVVSRNAQTDII
jgi:hypothetical protein